MTMDRLSGLAPVPAFVSVAIADLAQFSEIVKVLTLLLGCAMSAVMLVYWIIKVQKERAAERLAEITLAEAEARAKVKLEDAAALATQTIKDAEVKAAKLITDVVSSLKV